MERRGPETMSHSGFIACEQIKTSSLRESPVAPTIRTIPPAKLPTTMSPTHYNAAHLILTPDSIELEFILLSFNRTQVAYDQNFELNA